MSAVDSVLDWAAEKGREAVSFIKYIPIVGTPAIVYGAAESAYNVASSVLSPAPEHADKPLQERVAIAYKTDMNERITGVKNDVLKATGLSSVMSGASSTSASEVSSADVPLWLKVTIGASLVLGSIILVKGIISE